MTFTILATAKSQILEEATIADMECGECIRSGYIYCHEGTYGEAVPVLGSEPSGTCCENDECPEVGYDNYRCSNLFTDPIYAMSMCPFKKSVCGTTQTVDFDEVGDLKTLTMTGMSEGDSCTFKVHSSSGSPAFRVDNSLTMSTSNFEITYLEYDQKRVTVTGEAGLTTADSPDTGMPVRGQTFEDSGNQGNLSKGSQKKPPRRKLDGTMTEGETLDYAKEWLEKKEEYFEQKEEDENNSVWLGISWGSSSRETRAQENSDDDNSDDDNSGDDNSDDDNSDEDSDDDKDVEDLPDFDEKPRPALDERMQATDAVEGYGMPTKGIYDTDQKGFKTFGTTGQGSHTEGVLDISDIKSQDRSVLINIRALNDFGVDSLKIRTGNYEFLEEYQWGSANGLAASAATLALIGLSLI